MLQGQFTQTLCSWSSWKQQSMCLQHESSRSSRYNQLYTSTQGIIRRGEHFTNYYTCRIKGTTRGKHVRRGKHFPNNALPELKAPPEANMSQKDISANININTPIFLVRHLFRMRIWICMSNLLRIKRGVCPAFQLLAKTTTIDNCLHLHAPLVLTRTSIPQLLKKSVPTNGKMNALIALESTFFFPQGFFHLGYYNDKLNRIFIQAQLFCALTKYTDVLRLPRFIMKGKDVTWGHLDKSTLLELRDNLINNWDIHYSNAD
jgi:hypothetical protein